ncbi:hypothetical protein [Ramlibacter sp.]|uniref:hypothetical protein n=1 Tax=Ramlibacter sp. TaxID=1917967 RepID=UPI00262836CC|nr:hypothetical protein [Ramlibacter sp.]
MPKLLDLLRSTIRREREWAKTRVDHGDSTMAGQDDAALDFPATCPDFGTPVGTEDETIPGHLLP